MSMEAGPLTIGGYVIEPHKGDKSFIPPDGKPWDAIIVVGSKNASQVLEKAANGSMAIDQEYASHHQDEPDLEIHYP